MRESERESERERERQSASEWGRERETKWGRVFVMELNSRWRDNEGNKQT